MLSLRSTGRHAKNWDLLTDAPDLVQLIASAFRLMVRTGLMWDRICVEPQYV